MDNAAAKQPALCTLCGKTAPCLACYYEYCFCKCNDQGGETRREADACAKCSERLRDAINAVYSANENTSLAKEN